MSATLHPEDLPPGQVVGSAAGEPVIVSVIEFNEEAVLAIGTRGPTIPDGPREHLFDSMMRGTWSSDHLGLEIAEEIVRAHGGRIELTSDEGVTVFHVWLPKKRQNIPFQDEVIGHR